MFRKILSILAALVLFSGAAGAYAAEGRRAETRFDVTGADRLWQDAEQSAGQAMEEIAEAARARGLAGSLTEADLLSSGARILQENGMIYMIRSISGLRTVRNAEEAAEAAFSLVKLLGGDEATELALYARLGIGDTTVYGFCQVRDEEALYGRTLKIITGADGDVNTVISSLAFPEETDETLGVEEDLLGRMTAEAETPEVPDFEHMVRGEWRCDTEALTGKPGAFTVPVMQDPVTGRWFLGDPERKIVVGDFRRMVLYGQKDCLLSSSENDGWNPADVLTYYRILQCRDYYARKGLNGPDGEGTPILLLTNLCLANGESLENACYLGMLGQAWQAFAYSRDVDFGRCLDVLAHEYAHCLTEVSVPGGLYKDDYGAINEAISDILGNICEMQTGETADTEWYLGENLGSPFRAMSNPHQFNQPEYVWDRYYAPSALHPNDINDRGGVHTNSSILNYTASRLCLDEGMSLDEALDFWLAVDLGLSSRTDYYQMADLMEWALETVGLEKYRDSLRMLAGRTRMTQTGLPDTVPEGQMRVELTLPDTEAMKDSGWILTAVQVRAEKALGLALDMLLNELGNGSEEDGAPGFGDLIALLTGEEPEGAGWDSPGMVQLMNRFNEIFSTGSAWVSREGEPLTMILEQGMPTIYILSNIGLNTMETRSLALLVGNEWMDMSQFASGIPVEEDEALSMDVMESLVRAGLALLVPESTNLKVLPGTGLESMTLPALPDGTAVMSSLQDRAAPIPAQEINPTLIPQRSVPSLPVMTIKTDQNRLFREFPEPRH